MPVQLDLRAVKAEARELLRAAGVPPLRFTLLFLAVSLALNLVSTAATWYLGGTVTLTAAKLPFSFVSVLADLFSLLLLAGYTLYCLGVERGRIMPYTTLLDALPFAGKVILLSLAQAALIVAGLMLFIVPGVYFAFSYAFSLYHLCEQPELGVIGAMRRSRMETQGYKWALFTLLMSFLPLLLLAALAVGGCEAYLNRVLPDTLGGNLLYTFVSGVVAACAEVYLMPYLHFAQVIFYRRVTGSAAQEEENEEENRLE